MKSKTKGIVFEGLFKDYCERFIAYMQNGGYKYGISTQRYLRYISLMLNDNAEDNLPIITQEMANKVVELKEGENKGTRQSRVSLLRKFATFINLDGGKAYIFPKGILPVYRNGFIPYVFSHKQITAVLEMAEHMEPTGRSLNHMVFPVLLKVLYSAGLRLNEALSLKVGDYNPEDNSLSIHESKNFKSRIVPLSCSMGTCMGEYLCRMNFEQQEEHLIFPAHSGKSLNLSSAGTTLKSIYRKAGIPVDSRGCFPTANSLRHTFAIHALEKMHEQGMDSYRSIALLSQYLGHVSITETEKYLRLPQYKINGDEAIPLHSGRIPEVLYEEG
ncbi:Tyrosine recombinase XerD [subsurface metagenome]